MTLGYQPVQLSLSETSIIGVLVQVFLLQCNDFQNSKDSSYKKVQECLDVVAKEFKYQGHTMLGPCADAQHAGSQGRRTGNVARDIKRKFDRMIEDDVF